MSEQHAPNVLSVDYHGPAMSEPALAEFRDSFTTLAKEHGAELVRCEKEDGEHHFRAFWRKTPENERKMAALLFSVL